MILNGKIFLKITLLALLSFGFSLILCAYATADGPDYFQTTLQRSINLHLNSQADSKILTTILPGTRGLKNLGCNRSSSLSQWNQMNLEEKKQAKDKIWCKVKYNNLVGWIQNDYLHEDNLPLSPSYNCRSAVHQVEKLICSDPALMTLDNQMAIVYESALQKAASIDDDSQAAINTLKAMQRGWVKGRNDCWKLKKEMKKCISHSYSHRITYLQTKWSLMKPIQIENFSCGEQSEKVLVELYSTGLLPSAAIKYHNKRNVFISLQPKSSSTRYEGDFGSFFELNDKNAVLLWNQSQPKIICKYQSSDLPSK